MAHRTAMIDVGGGFRAIYGAGVMDRMLEDGISVEPLLWCFPPAAPTWFRSSRSSMGATTRSTRSTRFRKEYASFDSYVKNHNFANLDYVYSTLSNHDGENPVDYAAFEANPTGFHRGCVQRRRRLHEVFRQIRRGLRQFRHPEGVISGAGSLRTVCDRWRPYYDGGIADPIPVQKAIDDGYDRIVVILTRPKDTVREQKKDIGPATILKRTHPEAAEKLMNRYQTYNDEVALAKEYEKDGRVLILAPESMYGLNTLSKSFEGLERMYRAGYAAAAAIPAFLES